MQTKNRLGSRMAAMMAYHIVTELNLADIEPEFDQSSEDCEIPVDISFDISEYPGWRFEGVGSTRVALLRNNVIYKVEFGFGRREMANNAEYRNYQRIMDNTIDGWVDGAFRIPECELYEFNYRGNAITVIAMEYINGPHASSSDASDVDYIAGKHFGIDDTFSGNVRYDSDGNLVLIDFSR